MDQENKKLQEFHGYLKKDGYDVPSDYGVFEQTLKDPANSKVFYDALKKDGYDIPDYDTFVNDLGLKKKDVYEIFGFGRDLHKEVFGENQNPDEPVSKKPPQAEIDAELAKEKEKSPYSLKTPKTPFVSDHSVSDVMDKAMKTPEKEKPDLSMPDITLNNTDIKFPDNNLNDVMYEAMRTPLKVKENPTTMDYITALPQGFNKRMAEAIRNYGHTVSAPRKMIKEGSKGDAVAHFLQKALSQVPIFGVLANENTGVVTEALAQTIEKAGNPGEIPNDIVGKTLGSTGSILFDVMAVRSTPTSKLNALSKYGMERVPMFPTYLATMGGTTAAREGGGLKETAKATAEGLASGLTYEGMGITAGRVGQLVNELGGGQPLSTASRGLANSIMFGADSKVKGGSFMEGAAMGLVFSGYDMGMEGINRSIAHRAYVSYLTTTDNAIKTISKMQIDPVQMRKNADELWTVYEGMKDVKKPNDKDIKDALSYSREELATIDRMLANPEHKDVHDQLNVDRKLLLSDPVKYWEQRSKMDLAEPEIDLPLIQKTLETSRYLQRQHILEEKTAIDNILNVNAMTQEILKNPQAFIENIQNDARLSDKEKKIWIEKINTTIKDTDPRLQEAQPIADDIKKKEGELQFWQNDQTTDPVIKNAKIEAINTQIEEQTKALQTTLAKPLDDYAPKKETKAEGKEKESEQGIALGDKKFADENELNTYLESVAIDKKTGELDKTWFDREVNDWPSPETVKAVNKWTEAKKAEIKARKEKEPPAKEEPVETGKVVVEKTLDKNGLIDEIRSYNDMSASEKKKNVAKANTIRVNAQKLGYELQEGADGMKAGIMKDGKFLTVRKDPVKVDKAKIEGQKLLTEYEQDFQDYVNDVFETSPNLFGVMIGGLSNEQRAQAFKDIKAGKKSTASMTALNALEYMYKEHGGIDVWNADAQQKVAISREELRAEVEDMKRKKRGEVFNIYDEKEALDKGLITKDEYDELNEQKRQSETESQRAEEDFYRDETGNAEGSKEEKPKEVTDNLSRIREIEKIAGDEGYTFEVEADLDPQMTTLNVLDSGKNKVEIEDLPKGIRDLAEEYSRLMHEDEVTTSTPREIASDKQKQIDAINKEYDDKVLGTVITEKDFNKKYAGQHKDMRSKTEEEKNVVQKKIQNEGFKSSYVNATPISKGGTPRSVTERNYGNKKGDRVYLVPKEFLKETSNGPRIKDGWKPGDEDIVTIEYDGQSSYEAFMNKNKSVETSQKKAETPLTRDEILIKLNRAKEQNPSKVGYYQDMLKEFDTKSEAGLTDADLKVLSEINKVTAPSKLTRSNLSSKYGRNVIDKLSDGRYILFGADFNKFSAVSKRGRDVAEAYDKKQSGSVPPQQSSKPEGIRFKDKTYYSVEDVQDAFAEGKITFAEQTPLMEQVRKFEDNLKADAEKRATEAGKKLNMNSDKASDDFKKDADDQGKLMMRLLPPDVISKGNTVLWKGLAKVRDAGANWIAEKLQEGATSKTDALRWLSKTASNWFGGLNRTQRDIMGKLMMAGTVKEFAPTEAKLMRDKLLEIVNSDPVALQRVRDALDPEIAEKPLVYGDLSLSEKKLYDELKQLNTWVHETNYAKGFIDTETYLKFKDVTGDSKYIARMYDQYETMPPEIDEFFRKGNNSTKTKIQDGMYQMRKEVDEWKKEHAIIDPTYLTAKRVMQTIQNVAIADYMAQVAQDHPNLIRKLKAGEEVPAGFTKLSSSRKWGEFRNRAVANHIVEDFTGFFYANEIMNTTYNALKMFDRTKLNQFYKKYRTVYNPFVQLGNFTGNMFFASIAGVNPASLVAEMPNAIRDMNARTPEYKRLLKAGILGSTGITADMTPVEMFPMPTPPTPTETALTKARGMFEKMDEKATKLYQGADNVAKFSAYKIFRQQGLSHEQAVRRVYDAFQNYATVGKTWDVASKIPFVGNKFVKFQADLQRILLNSVTTSPLTTAGTLMLISLAGKMVSALSGETDEERQIRESRKGVAKIPLPFGASVPLSFKIGKSEVNMARYLAPLYIYKYEDSDADIAELSKFMPLQVQKIPKAQLDEYAYRPSFSDPTYGFIASVLFDRDFRGMSIANPEASMYHNPNTPTEVRMMNVLNYIGRSQVPFYRSAQDIYDGITGNLDYYGRKRDWKQSILNNIVKIQQFDKPELKSYVERNIDYLTNRFSSLSQRMGDANGAFLKALKDAKDKELPENVIESIYKREDRIRAKSIGRSMEKQVELMKELERLTAVYKRWNPDDPFVQENFANIQSGKNQRFNVLDDIDLQKKYKEEYFLMKDNGLLKRPELPSYIEGKQLTDEERKEYTSDYWSEYVRQLDNMIGLTPEEIQADKEYVIGEEQSTTTPEPKKRTILQEKSARAAERARSYADQNLMSKYR